MVTKISNGIRIQAQPAFRKEYSDSDQNNFVFTYTITIENCSGQVCQLLNRHWEIFDGAFEKKVVDGEGVIGEQPIIAPGEKYTYESYCRLMGDYGSMQGYYEMKNQLNNKLFKVEIPRFELAPQYRFN